MTNPTPDKTTEATKTPRPGSRLARLGMPTARGVLRQMAEQYGVCVRPIALRCIDTVTGLAEILEVPCGARLASKCKPCAERNRRLRIQQITEGWHLTEEPVVKPARPGDDVLALVRLRAQFELARDEAFRHAQWDQVADVDEGIAQVEEALAQASLRGHLTPRDRKAGERKTRSTKHRQDAPDLPRLKVEDRTLGKLYAARDGRTYRPSMLITLTLRSHGAVHTAARARRGQLQPCGCGQLHGHRDPLLGTPLDPASYDYRRAALDAIHFARVLDRWWQNLRRAAGWKIQYAGCVELQRRLAPHAHFAIRGTLPRKLLKQVAAATYHQVWWPAFDQPLFSPADPPVWNPDQNAYVHPATGEELLTWAEAMVSIDQADTDEQERPSPSYVARLGSIDGRGVTGGTKDAARSTRYIVKYVTKDITDEATSRSDPQREHFDRMHAELAVLPCSPTCANWLLYGIQPDKAKPGLIPGRCSGKVHQRATLGFTGRRVLISRRWSTRTLADVRADNRAWVRAVLAGALDGHEQDQAAEQAAAEGRPPGPPDPADGPNRYRFEYARPGSPGVPPLEHRILRAIAQRLQWRKQLDAAKSRAEDGTTATEPERRTT
jgi:hypothetical protein